MPDPEFPFRYGPGLATDIELRWQERWATAGTFRTPDAEGRPKFYILDMFPYPSGAGLHVGHPLGYIATDVYARFLRMTGHHVLHPFGYDATGRWSPAPPAGCIRRSWPSAMTSASCGSIPPLPGCRS